VLLILIVDSIPEKEVRDGLIAFCESTRPSSDEAVTIRIKSIFETGNIRNVDDGCKIY
jgi:hypothetical protein